MAFGAWLEVTLIERSTASAISGVGLAGARCACEPRIGETPLVGLLPVALLGFCVSRGAKPFDEQKALLAPVVLACWREGPAFKPASCIFSRDTVFLIGDDLAGPEDLGRPAAFGELDCLVTNGFGSGSAARLSRRVRLGIPARTSGDGGWRGGPEGGVTFRDWGDDDWHGRPGGGVTLSGGDDCRCDGDASGDPNVTDSCIVAVVAATCACHA